VLTPVSAPLDRPAGAYVSLVSATLPEKLPDAIQAGSGANSAAAFHLTLEDAKARVLDNSVVMSLASTQIAAKSYTMQAASKDYLPKLLNSFSYFHFDSDLGTVVKTPGVFNPVTAVSVPVVNQDAPMYTAMLVQPITPLLKVREAVNITAADVGAAAAQRRQARRELTKGVEQLYFGILATQRIKAGLEQAVAGAQQAAEASKGPDAQISLIQAQQGLLAANSQLVDLFAQMKQLIALPTQTDLDLEQPAAPIKPFVSVDEAVSAAVATSPKVQESRTQVDKADAAVRLAEADYVPSVLVYGLYVDQNSTPVIQNDFTGVGVSATYTLEWGKKNDTYRASVATACLARQALQKEIQDTTLNAAKAYNATQQAEQGLMYAEKLAALNQQVPLPQHDMTALKAELQARLESGIAAIKADLEYRNALVELRSMTGLDE
jgi:outer membrane protein TolC